MRITDLPILSTASLADILYIIDTSDTSDFYTGTSKQISLLDLFNSVAVVSSSYATTSSYSLTSSLSYFSQTTQDVLLYVKNDSGQVLPKGKVVTITGVDDAANTSKIQLADFSNQNNSANTLGFTNQPFGINEFGYVMTTGFLTFVDTSTFTSGDVLYLSSSGTYTNIKPTSPKYSVRLGQAIKIDAITGSIYVRTDNGFKLRELHDVIDTTTTGSHGDLLIKSGSVWINSKNLTGSYTATGSFSGQTGSFIHFNINNTGSAPILPNSSGSVGEIRFDNHFIYIYTNERWVRTPIAQWTT